MIDFNYLHCLRNQLGPRYGSEDLCVLLYSIVKREKPAVVVELGTGYGVTTAWIAAAMAENGYGKIYSFDDGSHFLQSFPDLCEHYLTGNLDTLKTSNNYTSFLKEIFSKSGVSQRVVLTLADMDMASLDWLDNSLVQNNGNPAPIDILFSDFNHSAEMVAKIVTLAIPRMNDVSSVFIDSASTTLASYLILERIVSFFQRQQVPRELKQLLKNEADRKRVADVVSSSTFKLMHLIEQKDRAQNSTAWLRIEPASLLPAAATCLH
jgi:predicted O-methyltransferase YrrM